MQKRVEPEIPRDLRSLIIPLWEQGYTYGQIAKKLGLGDRRGIVSGHVSRHKRGAQSLPVWPKHQFRCGHEKTDDNTTDGNGCRICNNARQRRLYARQKRRAKAAPGERNAHRLPGQCPDGDRVARSRCGGHQRRDGTSAQRTGVGYDTGFSAQTSCR